MTWLDGLDIPLVAYLDAGFFEFGPERLTEQATPEFSRAEVLWAHPGLYPIGVASPPISPLTAYRWAETDDALSAQLDLDQAGLEGAIEHGHAGVRFINPSTGRDALVTLRTEMHRLQPGIRTTKYRQAGSAVWEVFEGEGTIYLGEESVEVASGDLVAVPSWCWLQIEARTKLDLFTFSDTPVLDALGLTRIQRDPGVGK
jgi:gentisate 1,2-dioxygenase